MAGTEGTSKAEAVKADAETKKDEAEPTQTMRKYFLPETGQIVEALNAAEAATKAVKQDKKGNEG